MKKSLAKDKTPEEHQPDPAAMEDIEGTTAVAPREEHLPVAQTGHSSGDVNESDLLIPRLNIVQSVGPLSGEFEGGDLVLNGETVIAPKNTPVNITVINIVKYYEENLPYEANGPLPKRFGSIDEVLDAGMWTDWRGKERPPAREVAEATVLIQKPDDLESFSFSIECEDKFYALARWKMKGTAYGMAAKKIFTAEKIELRNTGLLSGTWQLSSDRQLKGQNYVFCPILRLTGKNSDDKIKLINELVG